MKYLRIILAGYKRMLLNGIEHFDMKIESPLQLILGTNGSGKSSLLWELSPLPADAKDFTAGGSKTLMLEHLGHQYTLASIFAGKQEHSFIFNGVELNAGRTITVQRDLVKEHFKMTTEIHDLVTGRERFDTMSTARRKEWFLRLPDVNYDYALQVYGKLKAALRDRTGAIRLEKKALVISSEKLLQEQEILRIQAETTSLHECLSKLLEHRKPVESDLTTLGINDDRLDKALVTLANQFTQVHERITAREHGDLELAEMIESTQATIISLQARIAQLADTHEQISSKIQVLQSAGEKTVATLEAELALVLAQSQQESSMSCLNMAIATPDRAYASFTSIKPTLLDIFSNIPNNADKRYSQAALLHARAQLDEQLKLKNNLIEQISDRRASLGHMRDHMDKPDTTCPKCAHAFSLVYSEERVNTLNKSIQLSEERLQTEIYPKITELESYIESCNTYAQLFRQYHQLQSSTPLLQPYWSMFTDQQILTTQSLQGYFLLSRVEQDLQHQIQMESTLRQIKAIEDNLSLLSSVGDTNLIDLQALNADVAQQLNVNTNDLQVAQAQNTHYRSEYALRREAINIRKNIRKHIASKQTIMNERTEHHRRTILNQLIRDLQSALATREHALFAAQQQRQIVDAMIQKIATFTQEEQALTVLVKELSPTEGLIAEGILGFIKNFCDQMNALIQKVWSYPLTIQSCEVIDKDGIDLDYRFPLIVGDELNPVSDVSKGSSGMQEIINLAFRLTAMKYLHLQDYPLHLDEFGSTFDKDHRTAAASMIRSLIEEHAFPQVFMISHYEGLYGALSNAQICVLNATNILTPKDYNQHVTMH